jgi:phosphatidate phosphatase APP1
MARVIEDWGAFEPRLARGLVGGVIASARRFATAEVPDVRVTVDLGSTRFETRTDDEGFVDVAVDMPLEAEDGWITVSLEAEGAPAPVPASVLALGTAELGIISDLDDTIIETHVTSRLRRAEAMFLGEIRPRRPFHGTRDLYTGLVRGPTGNASNPIVYVSSSPWNLYDHLEHFLEVNGLPRGPILLRDWGLHRSGFAPDGRHGHKLEKIERVLDAFPDLPFILIGDSSQEDAIHYREVVKRFPERIVGVMIRQVPSHPARIATLVRIAKELRETGGELFIFERTSDAVTHARERGWML